MDEAIERARGGLKRKIRKGGFSVRKQTRFLDALALTCNVRMAAAHAGISLSGAYKKRARDTVFAGQMKTAFEIGLDRLEILVLEHGGAGVAIEPDPERATLTEGESGEDRSGRRVPDGDEPDGCGPNQVPPPFDFDRAMRVLTYHRATSMKANNPTGRPPVNATREETNAALMTALAAVAKRMAREASTLDVSEPDGGKPDAGRPDAKS